MPKAQIKIRTDIGLWNFRLPLSSLAPLQSCQKLVGINFPSFWDRVGHAPLGGGVVGLLDKSVWNPLQYKSLEDYSSVINVVYSERTQCLKLWRFREDGDSVERIMFKSLYAWMTAYNCYHFSNLLDFLVMCSYFS